MAATIVATPQVGNEDYIQLAKEKSRKFKQFKKDYPWNRPVEYIEGRNVFTVQVNDPDDAFERILNWEDFMRFFGDRNIKKVQGEEKHAGAKYSAEKRTRHRGSGDDFVFECETSLATKNIDRTNRSVEFEQEVHIISDKPRPYRVPAIGLHSAGWINCGTFQEHTEKSNLVLRVLTAPSGGGWIVQYSFDGPDIRKANAPGSCWSQWWPCILPPPISCMVLGFKLNLELEYQEALTTLWNFAHELHTYFNE